MYQKHCWTTARAHERTDYFKDPLDGWLMGEAVADAAVNGANLEMRFALSSGESHVLSLPVASLAELPPLKNPDFMDNVNDLSLLSYLHEPAVFFGIRNRFDAEEIYTYSGMVLIAMNPFANVNMYSSEVMREYIGTKRDELNPHIYGIAEECYRAMLEGKNQSVIVSGESGAGKTQSTKYIMQYLAVVDSLSKIDSVEALMRPEAVSAGIKRSETEEAVLASNPILESFGNAKTTRNDNSSRFGKFVELFFSDPNSGSVRITGAKVRTYLLERSRLIFQPATERNYHIFYQLCAAVPAAEKKQLGLTAWDSFHYLNQGNAGVVRNLNDVEEFKATQDALSTLGMSVSRQWDIFRICAGLLHIGNIHVLESGTDGSTISATDPALKLATELLGINQQEFVKWITKKQTTIGREKFVKDLKLEVAVVSRDSVTKVIYTKLFDWLVGSINKNLQRDSTDDQCFIGVLDIYGFEHFKVNSFEQFCINYANEKLQQEFNEHVFRKEQEGYVQEAIQWDFIEFADNKQCIDLIEAKVGVLGLLDEETRLQNGKDETFVLNMDKGFAANTYYRKAKFGGNKEFTIRHYAVDVTYTASGFIEKNKDNMSDELQDVLGNSTNAFLKEVFNGVTGEEQSVEYVVPPKGDRRSSTMRQPTLGSMFKASLQGLMETIRETEGHYIRCIKPNMAKKAFEFEGAMVLSQLKACGVLETIKISNAGYPNKLEYEHFASRYHVLLPSTLWDTLSKRDLSIRLVTSVLSDPSKYQFGKTKVFLKSGQIAFFEDRRKDRIAHFVVLLTKNVRRFIQRKKYLRMRDASRVMQSAMRGFLARKRLHELREEAAAVKAAQDLELRERNAATMIQKCWRGYRARKEYKQCRVSIVKLQTAIRSNAARKVLQGLKLQAKDVEKVKEKAFSLENKVVELSQALRGKSVEAKEFQERCGVLEGQVASWKDKFEAVDAKNKGHVAEVAALTRRVEELTRESETLRSEKERFESVVSQAVSDGLIPPVSNAPALVFNQKSYRSVSQSPNRFMSIERTPSKDNTSTYPPHRQFGLNRTNTLDGTSSSERGRIANVFPQIRNSASPSNMPDLLPAIPFPGVQNTTPSPKMARTKTVGPTMTRTQTMGPSIPSLPRAQTTRIPSTINEDPTIASLRAENEALKKMLTGDPLATSSRPRPPMRSQTMRAKSIFDRDILDDAELERKKLSNPSFSPVMIAGAMDASSSGGITASPEPFHAVANATPIARRTTSLASSAKSLAARAEVLSRVDFNDVICDNLIVNLAVPVVNPKAPLEARDVFFPASIFSALFAMQIEQGMLVELHALLVDIVHDVLAASVTSKDSAKTAFWISNMHHLLGLLAGTYLVEMKKPNNRANMNLLRTVQTDLANLLETNLIPLLIKRLRDETAALSGPAILMNQDLPGMKSESTSFWGGVFGTPEKSESDLARLKSFLNEIDQTLCGYYVPDALYSRVMNELLRTIGVVSFNGMLVKRNFLNWKRGCQIQYNLNQLEEWCARHGLSNEHVERVAQAAKLLTINKTEAIDVQAVYEIAFLLNPSQIEKLYCNYSAKDPDSPMSHEFMDLVQSSAAPSRHRDVVMLSLDPEPEYPSISVTPVHDLEKLDMKWFGNVPPEFLKLIA
ncbi:Myosin type-2 heavy chain 1 [Podochytrium sp. JEL0797]|nr:Myosin type-2 heavy chain 1 [Podochytrium sp. JEL0797]